MCVMVMVVWPVGHSGLAFCHRPACDGELGAGAWGGMGRGDHSAPR